MNKSTLKKVWIFGNLLGLIMLAGCSAAQKTVSDSGFSVDSVATSVDRVALSEFVSKESTSKTYGPSSSYLSVSVQSPADAFRQLFNQFSGQVKASQAETTTFLFKGVTYPYTSSVKINGKWYTVSGTLGSPTALPRAVVLIEPTPTWISNTELVQGTLIEAETADYLFNIDQDLYGIVFSSSDIEMGLRNIRTKVVYKLPNAANASFEITNGLYKMKFTGSYFDSNYPSSVEINWPFTLTSSSGRRFTGTLAYKGTSRSAGIQVSSDLYNSDGVKIGKISVLSSGLFRIQVYSGVTHALEDI